jgi:WD40 repeat protein
MLSPFLVEGENAISTPHRFATLGLDIFLVFVGALLGIASNYATDRTGKLPFAFRLLQTWSLPIVGVSLLLLLCGRVWLYYVERPPKQVWTSTRPPFPGLEAFTELDAGVFFGRTAQIEQLMDRLQPSSLQVHRFVSVIGPSGAGKSSLVQAGLLSRLAQRRRRWIIVPPMVPENRPIENLAHSLAALLPDQDVSHISADLTADPTALARYTSGLRTGVSHRLASVIVVVDQAEELLTIAGEHEGFRFLRILRDALLRDSRLWVVVTLRSEFLTAFLQAGFADLFNNPITIGILDREALFEVIEQPATKAGLTMAPGVVSQLVDDAGSGDALPLLAYTLQAIYLRAGSGGRVTLDDYRQLGGVTGTLARHADKVTAELLQSGTSADAVATLLKFVTLDGTAPSRRRVLRTSLKESERAVVDMFIQARLLTSDSTGDEAVIDVAHEALFRHWAPLRQAIEARAEDLQQRTQLERWAEDWVHAGRRDSYLLRGERLTTAQRWAAEHDDYVADLPLVQEFLAVSSRSDHAALVSLSEVVARRALACVDQDPEQSVLLALAAIEECAPTLLAQRALITASASLRVRTLLRGHGDVVRAIDWSPNGDRIVTGSQDGTARIWDAIKGTTLIALQGHSDWIRGVAWSPDGRRIATVSNDRTTRIWDADQGIAVAVLHGHEGIIHTVAWSPDGKRIVTGSHDGTARIWDVGAGVQLTVLRGHAEYVRGVAWSPDGERVATASSDGSARIWSQDGHELTAFQGHDDWVDDVTWSPDGKRVATCSSDGTVRVWDADAGTELAVFRGHTEWVQGVDWSPDGRSIATASRDRTARIWDVEDGAIVAVLRGHTEWVHDVRWSPDGRSVATASHDRTARLWDVEDGAMLAVLRGHTEWVQGVDWSPDGRSVATASHDRTARIWDVEQAAVTAVLRGHDNWVHDVSWSPDGRSVATASRDRTARIWDVEQAAVTAVLRGHDDWVEHVAWSPVGGRIATGSNDHTARIWDAASGLQLAELRGHVDWVRGVSWSPDARKVVTGSRDGTARIWDAERGTELTVLRGHNDWIERVDWSPDGRRIATGSNDHTVRIWDAERGTELTVLRGHEDWIEGVAWSPDSRRIATGSSDCTARIWDADAGTELAVLCVHENSVEDVAWSPDGNRVITGSRDHSVRILGAQVSFETLAATARKRVLRKLTPEERRSAMLAVRP